MKVHAFNSIWFILILIINASCSNIKIQQHIENRVDLFIINGVVYTGENTLPQKLDIAVCKQIICGLYPSGKHQIKAIKIIDAKGKVVSPGFIDPHTHSLAELLDPIKHHNLNYLTQGVTTVVNGNDGGGAVDLSATVKKLELNKIGTNVALYVGHGALREQVMGRVQRAATESELAKMSQLLDSAMQNGALGLSTGLYYVPGSYANTEEVITLAKIAAKYNGIYDTHLRDESTFNIGFLAALDEAITIAKQAGIHLHLAHIKALGVDVWGQSKQAIAKIKQAQSEGVSISADQYPWLASGTKLRSAVIPKWARADSQQAFFARLNDPKLNTRLYNEIGENIRRRGGPSSLVITAFKDKNLVGLTLEAVAEKRGMDVIKAVKTLIQEGTVRVASFNMLPADVENFMVQPWVVTSSDGTDGHPRKFASFPQKYQEYIVNKKLITLGEFIQRSSAQTAEILNLSNRGILKSGYNADIIIFDKNNYSPKASYSNWNQYSVGVEYAIVNGEVAIEHNNYLNIFAGQFIN